MAQTISLAWRLLRGGGRRGLLGSLLMVAAVALSAGLLLFAAGAQHAFGERADADAWRHPKASAAPTAVEALTTDYVRGRPIKIVDLAALGGKPPVPPGMTRFPRPGEVWVSPALAALMKELPAGQLANRFVTPRPSGTLGQSALIHSGELVAVVGRTPGDPAMTSKRFDPGLNLVAGPARIAGYQTGAVSNTAKTYETLSTIAIVLMVVPLLVFGGAAARLTVARRDQRLSALRLVGATPGQVVLITVAEAVLTALAGTAAGLALYAGTIPAVSQITIDGGTWYTGDLWPAPAVLAAVLVAVPLLVGLSAVVGLRRVVISPLGVARRETPPRLRAIRILAFGGLLTTFLALAGTMKQVNHGITIFVIFLGLAILGLNLVGPWVVALIGRIAAGTARSPGRLLAGRRLIDDPRAAWRTVAGVALTGFVAGFLSLMSVSGGSDAGLRDRLEIVVPKAQAAAVADRARSQLAEIRAKNKITVAENSADDEEATVRVEVPSGAAELDRVRTALAGAAPGKVATTEAEELPSDAIVADLRTGALTVLGVSFLIAIVSAGITGASSVLDRRQNYALLRLTGAPLKVLDRARRAETLIPLVVMGGGSVGTGLLLASPFAMGFGPSGAFILVVFVALGFGGTIAASALSRPLLRSVTTNPAPRPD